MKIKAIYGISGAEVNIVSLINIDGEVQAVVINSAGRVLETSLGNLMVTDSRYLPEEAAKKVDKKDSKRV